MWWIFVDEFFRDDVLSVLGIFQILLSNNYVLMPLLILYLEIFTVIHLLVHNLKYFSAVMG